MTFLQPWAVWFLAGIPVIVLLYMLRLKRRDLTVSTHLFWQRIMQESSRRAFFHRLRHVLSLLLQILIFLLIAAALARPLWKQDAEVATNTVIVIDTRARMQAIEADGETRFAKAIAAAREYARQANARARMALVTFDHSARIAVPFTDDERALRDGLEKIRVTDAPGDAASGLDLAKAILAGRPGRGRVVVLTDRAMPVPASEPEVSVQALGSALDNAAITRFAIRPHPASRETAEVLLEVQNFGRAPIRSEIEFAIDGRAFEVRPLELAAGERRADIFSSVPRPGRGARGWLTARLKANDALASDNVAYAAHPARSPRRVLLVSAGNAFLEKLLAVDPATKFQFIQPDAWKPALAEKFETVIFDRFVPSGFEWQATPGNCFFIGANPFGSETAALDRPLITEVSANDPITRNVGLRNVIIQEARSLNIPAASDDWKLRAPIRSFEHALLVAGSNGSRRVAALAFDVLQSDLPLRIAFPLLISNALQWLDAREVDAPLSLTAGQTFSLQPEQSVAPDALIAPPKELPEARPMPVFEPLHNGYYLLEEGEERRWIAVNTFNAAESDLRQPDAPLASAAPTFTSPGVGPWPLWTWLTLAALALFTGEWWLFHRRKTE